MRELCDNLYSNDVVSRIKVIETHSETNPPTMQVLVSEGRVVFLRAEQIPMFLHLGVKSGAIGEELAKKVISDFKDVIPMVAVTDVTTQEQLDGLYDGLDKAIKAKLLASQESGKKLLVVVGESHWEKRSFLAESMIINIAKDLGINNLIMETTPQLLQIIKSSPIDSIMTPHYSTILKVAEARDMTLHNGDPGQDNPIFTERQEAMKKAIAEVDDNGVMIVGVLHLPEILEDVALQSQYEILAINASCIGPEKQAQMYRGGSCSKYALEYVLSSDNALQVSFPGNPYKLSLAEMLEMSFIAREHVTGAKAIESEVESKAPLVTPLQSVVELLTKSPGMTMEILTTPFSEKERTMIDERMSHPIIQVLNKDRRIVDTSMLLNDAKFGIIVRRAGDKRVQEFLTSGNLHISAVLYAEDEKFLEMVERLHHPIVQALNKNGLFVNGDVVAYDGLFERIITRASDKSVLDMVVQGEIHIARMIYEEDAKWGEIVASSEKTFVKELSEASSEASSRLTTRLDKCSGCVELDRDIWFDGRW